MSGENIQLAVTSRELRAGSRVLRQLSASDHPLVRRAVLDALGDLTVNDLRSFTAHCERAALAAIPAETRCD